MLKPMVSTKTKFKYTRNTTGVYAAAALIQSETPARLRLSVSLCVSTGPTRRAAEWPDCGADDR